MRRSLMFVSCVAGALMALTGNGAAQEPPLDQVLSRMATYAASFRRQLSAIVAEEFYVQDMRPTFGGQLIGGSGLQALVTHRELRSDVLMVRLQAQDGYVEFRDVFEVDGRAVRDRQERLLALFLKPNPDVTQQLERILADSARYNIGSVIRTINTPTIPLMFLEAEFQPRFKFARTRERAISTLGIEKNRDFGTLWAIDYQEGPKGTLIRRPNGLGDLPTQGRFWVEPLTGRVRMSELRIEDPIVRTFVNVVYDEDTTIGHLVPVEMRERYENNHDRSIIDGKATYGRFRRFGVSTEENIPVPKVPGR